MPNSEWFSNWFNTNDYHILYNKRSDEEATDFIKKLVAFLQPNSNAKMLDVACGKGRHSIALNELGYSIVGIDLSKKSIEKAKEFENENLHFYEHDMRLPFYVNYFDFVFNFFTSFGYFKTQREHNNSIRTLTQSLKKGGVLIIDYLNFHFLEEQNVSCKTKVINDKTFLITKWQTDQHIYKQIQLVTKFGLTRHLSTERVAKFSLADFNEMLSLQNMQIQKVFGNYDLEDYHLKKSPRMIIVAKKV